MKPRKQNALLAIALAGISTLTLADDGNAQGNKPCGIPDATVARVQQQLASVATQNNGGLFSPSRMWSAVIDRQGVLCSVIRLGDAWPGSRAIAIAKANTANAFSNDQLALSTANLYAPTQPGGSLYGLNNSNPFNPDYLAQGQRPGTGTGRHHHLWRGRAAVRGWQGDRRPGPVRRHRLRRPCDCLPHATPGRPGQGARRRGTRRH